MKRNMHSKTTVTVGIPAYNEESTCARLVRDVFMQQQKSFSIDKVIVYSDGSSDRTVESLKNIKRKNLSVIVADKRRGISAAQNGIVSRATGDILVLLNADIIIKNRFFLERLISPIAKGKAEITSGCIREMSPDRFIERVIFVSMKWKNRVFESYRNGDNLYTCHGPCRAFSKKYYTVLRFPSIATEDAYTYLFAKSRSFAYQFVKSAVVLYKLPSTLKDHEQQSKRFTVSSQHLQKHFDKTFVKEQYKLPLSLTAKQFAGSLLRYPVESIVYLGILFFIKMKSISYRQTNLFDIAISSKSILV